jgi:hypothetical protein
MVHELLNRGIYAVINKQLNLVYVGETQRNFLIRWIEHLNNIHKHFENIDRTKLFLHEHTKYITLKILNEEIYSKHDFYKYEQEAYEFYLRKGWGIVSRHTYNAEGNYRDCEPESEKLLQRYRKAINQISLILATKNTQHKNGSVILKNLYKQLEKKFGTDIEVVKGKSILSRLNKDELEFMLLELYPRFYYKNLSLLRDEYKSNDNQLSLL